MFINWATQEINLKIVYYGPGLSGKTTNIEYIHARLNPKLISELISLKTKEDRTLFFDFMQLELGTIKGKKPKFSLYTVPGQVFYASSRRVILNGVDGIVMVYDSQIDRMDANIESLNDLKKHLGSYGYVLDNFPFVIQYNKRDLPNISPIDELQKELNPNGVPYFEAIAIKGVGVFDTLKTIINIVIKNIQKQF